MGTNYLILQKGTHPIYAASRSGRLDVVKLLLDHGAQIDLPKNVSFTVTCTTSAH